MAEAQPAIKAAADTDDYYFAVVQVKQKRNIMNKATEHDGPQGTGAVEYKGRSDWNVPRNAIRVENERDQ